MPRPLLYVVLVLAALVAVVVIRAVLRARRRHVRRRVIDDRLDVPERTPIAERLVDQPTQVARSATCASCGHQHPLTSGVRSGDALLLDCPGCGRRTNHELVT
jgi:hypothetical protein